MFSLGYYWRIYRKLISIQMRSQVSYRTSFLLDVLAAFVSTAVAFLSTALVFQRFEHIGGWGLWDVAFLYGSVELAFGIMDMLFSGFDPQNFGKQVRLGRLDQLLLKPVSATVQVMGSEFILRRVGRISQGVLVLGLALYMGEIVWTPGKVLYLPVVILSLAAFFGGIFIIGATLTFWTYESIEAVNILSYGGAELLSWPFHIYPDILRGFFTYIVPGVFLSYLPALYFLEKPDPLNMPVFTHFLAPAAGLGVLGAALLFWNYGLKHYQSTGT